MELVWDEMEDRTYETGLDRGVLYPPSGAAVPWNGLLSVNEKSDSEREPIYFDGQKINDLVAPGDFEATMKALTYPDKFTELEGMVEANPGMFLGNQSPKSFGLSYRTKVGNALDPAAGYKIHILYNVVAVPSDREFATETESPSLTEFEWDITAIPEEVPGFRPTAHIVVNSINFDPVLLQLLEDMLYGTSSSSAELLPMAELILFLNSWYTVLITDNGDGTWSASSSQPGVITFLEPDLFQIDGVDGGYLDADTYQISTTL